METKEFDLEDIYELYEASKIDEALKLCDDLLKTHKDNRVNKSVIHYYKGLIYEDKSEYNKALASYEKAIESNSSEFIDPLLRQYEVYRGLNYLNEALEVIEKIIRLYPEDFYGYDLKFNFLFNMGAYEEAEKVIEYLDSEFEESPIILLNLIKVYTMTGKADEALKIIEDNLEHSDIHYDLLKEKGKTLLIKEQFDESLSIFQELNNKFKENSEIIYIMSSIYIMQGKLEQANKVLKSLLDLEATTDMSYLTGLYYYGVTLKYYSQDESERYFKALLRKYNTFSMNSPNDLNILLLRGMCCYEIKNYNEALRIADYVDNLSPGISETIFLKSLIYSGNQEAEKYELSKKTLEKTSNMLYQILLKIEEVKK